MKKRHLARTVCLALSAALILSAWYAPRDSAFAVEGGDVAVTEDAGPPEDPSVSGNDEITQAGAGGQDAESVSVSGVNPLYADELPDGGSESGAAVYAEARVEAKECATEAEAVLYLRERMVARDEVIAFSVPASVVPASSMNQAGLEVIDKRLLSAAAAYSDTCSGNEGDALAWAYRWHRFAVSSSGDRVVATYTFQWHSDADQEAALTAKVSEIKSALNVSGSDDYGKVRAIHDWICDNVDYDYSQDEADTVRFSAYAAAVNGKAVCQGYSILFYRLCREYGIPVRIVAGTAVRNNGPHGWNLVQVADRTKAASWYNVDCTWDGQDGKDQTRHDYFLKSDADFALTHTRGADYSSFPKAEKSWDLGSGEGWNIVTDWNKVDDSKYPPMSLMKSREGRLTPAGGSDDYFVSKDTSKNNKIYVFLNPDCSQNLSVASGIKAKESDFDSIDVYFIAPDRESDATITSFRSSVAPSSGSKFKFMYRGQDLQDDWLNETIEPAGHSIDVGNFPIIVYVDGDQKVQYASFGSISAQTILDNVGKYCKASSVAPSEYKKITYNLDGGINDPGNRIEYLPGTSVFTLLAPTKDGFTFKGWYRDAGFTDKVTGVTASDSGDLTFYAKWDSSIAVTYNLNGGMNHPDNPLYLSKGANEVVLKAPTKEGSSFLGWYSDEALTAPLAGNKIVTTAETASVTVWAKWTSAKSVTYVLDGGTNDPRNPSTYEPGVKDVALYPASKQGAGFAGWYSDAAKTVRVASILKEMSGDLTLYAKWSLDAADFPQVDLALTSGNAIVGIPGTYTAVSADAAARILAELNRIRKEACDAGLSITIAGETRRLTAADYVPLKWSSDMEAIARQRAAEVSVLLDNNHMRPNGKDYNTLKTRGGKQSMGENLFVGNSEDFMNALAQWYAEKDKFVSEGWNGETGHYANLINPLYTHVGMSVFKLDGASGYPMVVTQELTMGSSLAEAVSVKEGFGYYGVEVSPNYVAGLTLDAPAALPMKVSESKLVSVTANVKVVSGGTVRVSRDIKGPVTQGAAWSSSDKAVASVSDSGLIKALKNGTTAVTASAAGKSAKVDVTVTGGSSGSSGGSGGSGSSGGSDNSGGSSSTPSPSPSAPADPVAAKWDNVRAQIASVPDGGTVSIDMAGQKVVPGSVFAKAKGRNVNIVINMGNGVIWGVNGMFITSDAVPDVDMSVALGTNVIPANVLSRISGGKYVMQLHLAHNGVFGFTASLAVQVGKQWAGKAATMYYYNPATGKLEDMGTFTVDANGLVQGFAFTHASDYALAIDTGGKVFASPQTGSPLRGLPWGAYGMCAAGLAGIWTAFFILKRKGMF